MGYRNYAPANGFHVNANGTADFTSVNSAIAAATAGQTVYLHGSVTEDPVLKAGVDVVSWPGEGLTPNATIIGNCTFTGSGSVNISGIRLQTNSAAFLSVTGSAASIVNLNDCYLNCTNSTGITFSSSSASSAINIKNCRGDLGTTGIAYHTASSAGILKYEYSRLQNSGLSTTASNNSSSQVHIEWTSFAAPLSTSSTGALNANYSNINTSGSNVTSLTWNGSGGGTAITSMFDAGSASAISIGASAACAAYNCIIGSTNTNAITGAGTLSRSGLSYSRSSSTVNTTTQNVAGTLQGNQSIAPTAGFLGEKIESSTGVGTISLSTGAFKTIVNISLTPGTFLLNASGILSGVLTGTRYTVSISATNNAVGSLGYGIDTFDTPTMPTAAANVVGVVPGLEVTVTTTTTYYLTMQATFTVGTAAGGGRLTATRIG